MLRIQSTGIFLDPDDLATVRMLLLVAGRHAADATHEQMPLPPMFSTPAEAHATLRRINAFQDQLDEANAL